MGLIRNEMVVVHCFDENRLRKIHHDAIVTFDEATNNSTDYAIHCCDTINMISLIMHSVINDEYTFVINGDCSKDTFPESVFFHELRMNWCKKHEKDEGVYIVVINFGEGDDPCQIVYDNTGRHDKKADESNEEQSTDKIDYSFYGAAAYMEFADAAKDLSDTFKDAPEVQKAIKKYTITLAQLIGKIGRRKL